MGASSSIHPEVIKSIEVSFVDKTGSIISDEEIKIISKKSFKEFDYHQSFYDAYKLCKDGKTPYEEYSRNLTAGLIR